MPKANAISQEMVKWDFGNYTINLPADVEEQVSERDPNSNSYVYSNPEKTFFYFPAFYSIDEDFDCAEFLHTVAMDYFKLDTDKVGIMLLSTGKETPMLFSIGQSDTHMVFMGVYPDYDLNEVCIVAFAIANEEDISPTYYGSTFRIKDNSTE